MSPRNARRKLSFRFLNAVASLTSWGQRQVANRQNAWLLKLARETAFRPRPDDVFVVSYPKSGATLLQMMLYQLTTAGEMDFPHIEAVAPWYERAILSGNGPLLESAASPRLFKSHARYELLPAARRFVYVARDVKDVAVSSYHHYCLITGVEHDFEELMDRFVAGRFAFGSWFEHLESWWPHRHDDNVLFLIFDQVVADLAGAVRKVADFCDLALDEEVMSRALERCDIGFMKRHRYQFDPRLRRLSATPAGPFVDLPRDREGVLNPRQEAALAKRLDALAAGLGWDDDPVGRMLR